ncbi:2-keto-4-pentenoate hydratase [Kribbella kalugense]|uniref:2-keto-4-pentenoate hydratase n=1 Tax=Kribbella kalugense TaxID=2512221 RepID=A0A4R8A222_9ACTN|nr:2-keto-4-pentenoate hydratase [Kribbella kalugense]TDW24472.1 2-keto-4-pentenoate hydratase [Kribbella kalugense]
MNYLDVADALAQAERDRHPIPPIRETWPELTVADSYQIQLLNVRGRPVSGHKVGLSSKAMQRMLGVDEPDYGHLLAEMELFSDRPVPAARYCAPRIEAEVAFVLGRSLPASCTEENVLAATEYVVPALEVIDSRIAGWDITIIDTVADNASSAGYVLGADRAKPDELDLLGIEVRLSCNGEEVAEGRSDAVLGNPATAVAWLANKVAAFGVTLEAGHVILPGAVHRAVDVQGGDSFEAVFDGLGRVSMDFSC